MIGIKRFCKDERGYELTEYAVAAALITAAIVVAFHALKDGIAAELSGLLERITP